MPSSALAGREIRLLEEVVDDARAVVEPVVEGEPGVLNAARHGEHVCRELVLAIENDKLISRAAGETE